MPQQLKHSQWLLDLAFLTDLTANGNELNIELQNESKSINEMTGTTDSFKGRLQLRRKECPGVNSPADGTVDVSWTFKFASN
jgi:hypothetical protein